MHCLNSRSQIISLLCIMRLPCSCYLFFISCFRTKRFIDLLLSVIWTKIFISLIIPIFKHHLSFHLGICISCFSHWTHLELGRRIFMIWLVAVSEKNLGQDRFCIAIFSLMCHFLCWLLLICGFKVFWLFSRCENVAWCLVVFVGFSCAKVAVSWFRDIFKVFRWMVVRSCWKNFLFRHRCSFSTVTFIFLIQE